MKASRQGINKLTTAKERIKAFLVGDDVTLSPEEITILTRWEKVDLLYRQSTPFEDIIKALTEAPYSVSRFTAQNDVFASMEVFASSRKVNKKYILYLKFERQLQDIERYRESIFKKGKFVGDQKDIMALAKLEEAATYTLNSMPQDVERPPFVPTKVVLNLVKEDAIPLEMPLADALKLADSYIKNLPIAELVTDGEPDRK